MRTILFIGILLLNFVPSALAQDGLEEPKPMTDKQFNQLLKVASKLPSNERVYAERIFDAFTGISRNYHLQFFRMSSPSEVSNLVTLLTQNVQEQHANNYLTEIARNQANMMLFIEQLSERIAANPEVEVTIRYNLQNLQEALGKRHIPMPMPDRCFVASGVSGTLGGAAIYLGFKVGDDPDEVAVLKNYRMAMLYSGAGLVAISCMADMILRRTAFVEYWNYIRDYFRTNKMLNTLKTIVADLRKQTEYMETLKSVLKAKQGEYSRLQAMDEVRKQFEIRRPLRESKGIKAWRAYLQSARAMRVFRKMQNELTEIERDNLLRSIRAEDISQKGIKQVNQRLLETEQMIARDFAEWLSASEPNTLTLLLSEIRSIEQENQTQRALSGSLTMLSRSCYMSLGTLLSIWSSKTLFEHLEVPVGTTTETVVKEYGNTFIKVALTAFAGFCGAKYFLAMKSKGRGWWKEHPESMLSKRDWKALRYLAEFVAAKKLDPALLTEPTNTSLKPVNQVVREAARRMGDSLLEIKESRIYNNRALRCADLLLTKIILEPFR